MPSCPVIPVIKALLGIVSPLMLNLYKEWFIVYRIMATIAIDARESGTTTGRYVDKLIENFNKLDLGYDLVILTKKHRIQFFKDINPAFNIVETPYIEFSFSEQMGFKKQLKNLKANLIHFGMVQQPILYRGKTVTTMHDLTGTRFNNPSKNWVIYKIKQLIYKFVNWYVPRKSKAIIVPSKFVKKDILEYAHLKKDNITVTYEAADLIPNTPEPLTLLLNEKFIMYVGRPMPHKNLRRLIQAFANVRSQHPDLKLAIVGKNDIIYEGIKNFAYEYGVEGIMFTDFVSEGQLRWLYENCEAYIFPSLSEGFGLPGLEAMIHGAPVVSSDATCLPEIYGKAAEYFNPLSIEDMSKAISRVIDNKKRRKELIELGHKKASEYSWKKMAEQTLKVYKDVLKSK
jgi:glycosyltransferase involved in cell wall biosynthesis